MTTSGSSERSMLAIDSRLARSTAEDCGGASVATGPPSSGVGCRRSPVGPSPVIHLGSQHPVVDPGGPVSLPDSLTTSAGGGFRPDRPAPDRNLALELVRVTEAAAMAAGRWVGRGDKNGGDGAAVDAMRALIGTVSMKGVVVIGEGEKDQAPMLYNGEQVGDGQGPECDVAVDPIDGTTLMAKGMPNAIAVMAGGGPGAGYEPPAGLFIGENAPRPPAAAARDTTAPVAENVRRVAKAKHCSTGDVT